MAKVTIKIGHIEDDPGEIVNVQSPKPPFQVALGQNCREYSIANGDYASADDLDFDIAACDGIKWASFTGPDGAVLLYTESTVGSPLFGKRLALTNVTATVVKSFIVHNI